MKRRLLIFSSLITLLLSCFSFPIFAEESIEDIEELAQVDLPDYALDQYFYDNYDLLPYLESEGRQYINTGIKPSSNLKFNIQFTINKLNSNGLNFLFGSYESGVGNYTAFYQQTNDKYYVSVGSVSAQYNVQIDPYSLHNLVFDRNILYFDSYKYTFSSNDFVFSIPLYLFSRNTDGNLASLSYYKIYKCSIYDYSLNNGEGGYVRYYYPAKSKSGGIIGLYDSISKSFVTTGSSVPFSNPIDDQVISFQINDFLDASLNWIEAIFLAIVEMPIIIVFMAIGLAGAMFRWGRRIVHF